MVEATRAVMQVMESGKGNRGANNEVLYLTESKEILGFLQEEFGQSHFAQNCQLPPQPARALGAQPGTYTYLRS